MTAVSEGRNRTLIYSFIVNQPVESIQERLIVAAVVLHFANIIHLLSCKNSA